MRVMTLGSKYRGALCDVIKAIDAAQPTGRANEGRPWG